MNNKELFINDLYLFYRYFIAADYPNSVPAPHIKELAHELMKLMVTDEYHRLAVSMPPRHSKSSMVTLSFPLWLIFQNPNRNILIITTGALTEKFGIKLREYVREYGSIFNCYLSDVKKASTHIMFCDKDKHLYKGSIRLTGMGGSVTGHDADIVILDDPYKGIEEEFTPTALQKKIDWVNRVLEQRIEPHTRYCVLHTRWHPIQNECPVPTTEGWKTHGELKEGDYVFSPEGKPVMVKKVHPKTIVNNCFELSNGDHIISGDHHLWKVYDWGNRKYRVMETSEIMKRQTLIGKTKRSNFLIDPHAPLEYPPQEVPIDPYWLGLWLGDGHHKRPSITLHKNNKITTESTPYKVIRYDERKDGSLEAFYTHQGLTQKLREIGVYGNKHIPDIYLHNTLNIRMELLAGLIDSDGYVEKKTNRVSFINTNKKLLQNVHELMTGLGFTVKHEKTSKDKINKYKENSNSQKIISKKDCYKLRITPHHPIPTRLPYKKVKGKGHPNRIGITKTYKVQDHEGNCITIDSPDGLYIIGKNGTTTHNSNDIIGYYRQAQPHLFKFINFSAIQPDGTPLWKEKYTTTELLTKKKNMGERMFSSIYQQVPLDLTSDYFTMERIKYGKPDPDETITHTCRSWDIAGANNLKGDYTCGALLSKTNKDNIILHDIVHGKYSAKTANVIKQVAEHDGPSVSVLLETGVAGAGFLLFEEWKSQLEGFMVEQSKPVKSKVDRATPLRNLIFDGRFFVDLDGGPRQILLDEFSSFPNGDHDDIVDAVAHGVNWLKFKGTSGNRRKPGLIRIPKRRW